MKLFRIDSNNKKLEWQKLDNGSYKAYVTLGIADLPLEYQDISGNKYIETITENELFNDDSLLTAHGLPITFNHPKFGIYNQNAENILVGSTLETYLRQDKALLMPAIITDKRAIALIDNVLENNQNIFVELSPGYWLKDKQFNKDSNVWEQINRTYDHLALLNPGEGRGGQKIILRTDSNISLCTSLVTENTIESYESDYGIQTIETEIATMTTRKISYQEKDYEVPVLQQDGKDYVAFSEVQALLTDSNLRIDSKQKNLKSEIDSANGKLAALQIQLDSKAEMITLDQASGIISESIELWQKVEPIFKADSKDFKPDYSLNPTQIKELYIKKFHPSINLDNQSAVFVDGVWSGISPGIVNQVKDNASNKVQAQLDSLKSANTVQTDSADDEIEKAYRELESRVSSK
ncbi:hypothetical protein NIES2100_05500 [Calothrix sp. NIES-2100]|uniref:DUF2213 domain-containing protein n=1 Tax=Calothrix sp. NIES-2100 TaxID=1954172 RepID=UPI000B5F9C07|nr:hypothetical protein NIES2100_05500 [Calothrix sp. NIES-2100]